jgi:hypothetical protein
VRPLGLDAVGGDEYLDAPEEDEHVVAKNVTENIYDRHIKQVFIG